MLEPRSVASQLHLCHAFDKISDGGILPFSNWSRQHFLWFRKPEQLALSSPTCRLRCPTLLQCKCRRNLSPSTFESCPWLIPNCDASSAGACLLAKLEFSSRF